MKKQSLIRILMVVMIVTAAALMVAASRTNAPVANTEVCTQQEDNECVKAKSHSEFLIESLTRNLLSR